MLTDFDGLLSHKWLQSVQNIAYPMYPTVRADKPEQTVKIQTRRDMQGLIRFTLFATHPGVVCVCVCVCVCVSFF